MSVLRHGVPRPSRKILAYSLRWLFLRLLLLWGYRLGRLRPKLPARRNRETLWRSRLLLLLLLALQFLQELFRSLDPWLTVWLLLLLVSLSGLVGCLILQH